MIAPMPQPREDLVDEEAEEQVRRLMEVVRAVREIKSRFALHAKTEVEVTITAESETPLKLFERNKDFLYLTGQIKGLRSGVGLGRPSESAAAVCGDVTLFVHLGGLVDFNKEKARLKKELQEVERRISRLEGLLANKEFLSKAPESVVKKQRSALQEAEQLREKLKNTLSQLPQ